MTHPLPSPLDDQDLLLLKRLHLASLLEGVTLIILLGIAVPLKHLAGLPQAVTAIGPLHGLAFVFYAWMVINTASGGMWRRGQVARLLILAFVPFGTFFNVAMIKRREAGPAMQDRPVKETEL